MMKIPLISQSAADECAAWKQALNQATQGIHICDLAELTASEKKAVKVAVVANPNSNDLQQLPHLEWVQSLWAGVEGLVGDHIRGSLKVVRLVDDRLAQTMAESALAWVMYLQRNMPLYRQQQQTKQWVQHPVKLCAETQVGVLGLGKLGKSVAQKLSDTGFNVSGWSRNSGPESDVNYAHVAGAEGLDYVLKSSDILIILLPLTAQTFRLLNADQLAKLPYGAGLINFARGAIIDNDALLEQLNQQRLAHAVLDVFDQEPLPSDDPFWAHSRVTVLPHIAAPTDKASAAKIVAEHLRDYLVNGKVPAVVDRSRGY